MLPLPTLPSGGESGLPLYEVPSNGRVLSRGVRQQPSADMTLPGQFDEMDRANLGDELTNIKKNWWVFPDWLMLLGLVVALCSLFFFVTFSAGLVGMLASIYCATQVAYRRGVYFGFARGFEQGHEEAVRSASEPLAPPPPPT